MADEIVSNLLKVSTKVEETIRSTTISQKCLRIIDAALSMIPRESNMRSPCLRSLLHQTMIELQLSELEVVIWIMHLDEMRWNTYNFHIKMALLFPAFATKIKLQLSVSSDMQRFHEKIPNILQIFKEWLNVTRLDTDISLIKINKRYKELSIFNTFIPVNYNYYVDDILTKAIKYEKTVKNSNSNTTKMPTTHSSIDTRMFNSNQGLEEINGTYLEIEFSRID